MVRGAAELLRQRGYTGTGFREVIEVTGAPRGSIYHHFPGGKAQLAGEAVDYVGALARASRAGPIAEATRSPRCAASSSSGARASSVPATGPAARSSRWRLRATTRHRELLDSAAVAFDALARGVRGLPARAGGLAAIARTGSPALIVAAVEGAIVLSRAERDPAPLLDVAAELELAIEAALPAWEACSGGPASIASRTSASRGCRPKDVRTQVAPAASQGWIRARTASTTISNGVPHHRASRGPPPRAPPAPRDPAARSGTGRPSARHAERAAGSASAPPTQIRMRGC